MGLFDSIGGGDFFGGLGSAIGGIAGGLLSRPSGGSGHSYQYYLDKDYAQQERIAKNQASWLVEGAKKAGLHPLVGIGIQPASGGVGRYVDNSASTQRDYSWLQNLGQGIGRAADAYLSREERAQAKMFADMQADQQLRNNQLQNEYLEAQIAAVRQDSALRLRQYSDNAVRRAAATPAFPLRVDGSVAPRLVPGQGDAPYFRGDLVRPKPSEPTANAPGHPYAEAGSSPDVMFNRTAGGGYAPVPSKDAQDGIDASIAASLAWTLRNHILPSFDDQLTLPHPPDSWKRDDEVWQFNILRQAWYAVPKDSFWRRLRARYSPY